MLSVKSEKKVWIQGLKSKFFSIKARIQKKNCEKKVRNPQNVYSGPNPLSEEKGWCHLKNKKHDNHTDRAILLLKMQLDFTWSDKGNRINSNSELQVTRSNWILI